MPFIFQLILTNSIPNRSEIDSIRRIASFLNFVIFFFFRSPPLFHVSRGPRLEFTIDNRPCKGEGGIVGRDR